MYNDQIKSMWESFRKNNPDVSNNYVAWAFGDSKEMADELAALVLAGMKTATASNFTMYEIENAPLPKAGLYNAVLDGNGRPVAIIKTTSVTVVPFNEVTSEHAYLEGEGDRTLRYWQEVHEEFFTKELAEVGREFHEQIPVVCERFQVVYPQ